MSPKIGRQVIPQGGTARSDEPPNTGARAHHICPLCHGHNVSRLCICDGKPYWRCSRCQLTFLDPTSRLTSKDEHTHYLSHENNVADPGYRRFLARLADPLLARMSRGSSGLDYGCGPGPALAHMLHEAGHQCAVYDPFFACDPAALSTTYDFVTCTEVVEHFHEPASEFAQFDRLLRPGGWLGLMTCFQTDDVRFAEWHYRKDPTHVAFYKVETLAFVADQLGWHFESPAKDIALMKKPANPDRAAAGA